jgi:hypothetical protein
VYFFNPIKFIENLKYFSSLFPPPPLVSSEVLSPAVHLLALRQTVGDHDYFKAEFLLLVYRNKTLSKGQ